MTPKSKTTRVISSSPGGPWSPRETIVALRGHIEAQQRELAVMRARLAEAPTIDERRVAAAVYQLTFGAQQLAAAKRLFENLSPENAALLAPFAADYRRMLDEAQQLRSEMESVARLLLATTTPKAAS